VGGRIVLGPVCQDRPSSLSKAHATRSYRVGAELLKLALALGTTIEQLLDTRGPERIRGPHLALYDRSEDPTERTPFHIVLPPTAVSALVCTHPNDPCLVAEWDDHWISHLHIVDKEQH
jgi:hypothetical protein